MPNPQPVHPGEIVIFQEASIICPAGQNMRLNRVSPDAAVLSKGPLTVESARSTVALPPGYFDNEDINFFEADSL